jgi:hypothetical protein
VFIAAVVRWLKRVHPLKEKMCRASGWASKRRRGGKAVQSILSEIENDECTSWQALTARCTGINALRTGGKCRKSEEMKNYLKQDRRELLYRQLWGDPGAWLKPISTVRTQSCTPSKRRRQWFGETLIRKRAASSLNQHW